MKTTPSIQTTLTRRLFLHPINLVQPITSVAPTKGIAQRSPVRARSSTRLPLHSISSTCLRAPQARLPRVRRPPESTITPYQIAVGRQVHLQRATTDIPPHGPT
ncbi:hypothetical protein BC567DRAFT_57635 [Phyllosticta citribraziliensis]